MDVGGYTLFPPSASRRWHGTFGQAVPCSNSGSRITITGVDYHYLHEPVEVLTVLRSVPSAADAPGVDRYAIGARLGTPKHFDSRPHREPGTYTNDLDSITIENACDDMSGQQPFLELLTIATFDTTGGWIDTWSINYTSDGESFTLPVQWEIVGCGTAVLAAEGCGSSHGR